MTSVRFRTLFLFCCWLAAIPAVAQQTLPYATDQVIVRFDKPTTLEEAKVALDDFRFTVTQTLVSTLDIYLIKLAPLISVEEAIVVLKADPRLRWAQADHYLTLRNTPNDPLFGNQWNMNQASDADIDAPEAWNLTTGGTDPGGNSLVIAIVDGGCLLSHQDLSNNIWVNSGEIPGNGQDDDGNGYVDDVNGWDAYNNDGSIPISNHGTHVSGIAGARGNNGTQVCGVNWNVKLMQVAASSTQTSIISIGYNYVLTQKNRWLQSGGATGANVVATNSSFGVDYADCSSGNYPIWNDLYNAMGAVGILSACATANLNINVDTQGDVPTGCTSPYIIAVTNTTSTDQRNSGAAYGPVSIDLGAPGTSILSTTSDNSTAQLTGTSMASPHVAGAVAFLHAAASAGFYAYYVAHPDSAALALKQIILNNVDPIAALQGITVSGGRLNLFNAAAAISVFMPPDTNAPNLIYAGHVIEDTGTGNGDGFVDAGETARLIVSISNTAADAFNVIGTLAASDPYLTVTDSVGTFGNVPRNAGATNALDPFVVTADPSSPLEHNAQFTLRLSADGAYTFTRTFSVLIGRKVVYWSDSVEYGENGWTHSNVLPTFGDQWHISTEQFASPGHAWKCGDPSSGTYASRLDAGLVSPLISVTPQSELLFTQWMESELSSTYTDSAYDGGVVEISANGGPFIQVTPNGGYPKTFRRTSGGANPYTGPMPGQRCYAGTINWQTRVIDLTTYAGQQIRVRFRFGSDNGTNREGWYVDDILVRGEAPQNPIPNPVNDLVILPQGNDIGLYWTAPPSGASYYVIYRDTVPDFTPAPEDSVGWSADTLFIDYGIGGSEPKSFYSVKVVR